jgi:prepilin-type N-terminal cleavage/methylation domain-containing protein
MTFFQNKKTFKLEEKNMMSGFTLVELLVAVGVFLVVMTISLGSVLSILDAGRKARSLKSVMTNLNFTLETMTREIKFGTNYYCGEDTSSQHTQTLDCAAGNAITFTDSNGVDIVYKLVGTQIQKSTNHGPYIGVTSPEVTITNFKIFVIGSETFDPSNGNNDMNQPRTFVLLRGYVGSKPALRSSFALQTTISQRIPDRFASAIPAPPPPPPGPPAGIAFAAGSSAAWLLQPASAISWSHTTSGNDRLLVVGVAIRGTDQGDEIVSSITYGGISLTKILDNGINPPTGPSNLRTELWYLANPSTGSNTVNVTLAGAVNAALGAGAVSFTGVDQSSPIGPSTNNTLRSPNLASSISTNLSSTVADSVILDMAMHRNDVSITEGINQSLRVNSNNGSSIFTLSTKDATAVASYPMSWSNGTVERWDHLLVEIKPAP